MRATAFILSFAVVSAAACMTTAGTADETHSQSFGTKVPAGALSTSISSDDPLLKQPSSEDLASRVDQLEATRAAVDQQSKSPISLSISGWVDQQVTYTRQ
jgi:hypothetical protein